MIKTVNFIVFIFYQLKKAAILRNESNKSQKTEQHKRTHGNYLKKTTTEDKSTLITNANTLIHLLK